MRPLLVDGMGAERLLQSCSLRLKQNSPRTERLRFHQLHQTALGLMLARPVLIIEHKPGKKLLLSCSLAISDFPNTLPNTLFDDTIYRIFVQAKRGGCSPR
jgi:hypothetical protein